MPFTDETTIRTHTGWNNTDLVTVELIELRLADAHATLLECLDPEFQDSTNPLLKLAETELTIAYLLRSMAADSGFNDRDLRTARLTLRAGGRAHTLQELAEDCEQRAWGYARPFLRISSRRIPLTLVSSE